MKMQVHKLVSLSVLIRSTYSFHVGAGRARQPFFFRRYSSLSVKSSTVELSEQIRHHWERKETDGILELASQIDLTQTNLEDLLFASLESVQYNRGKAAGIINSWIASCNLMEDKSTGADLAWRLLETFQEIGDSVEIYPDIVTFSLAYSALTRPMQENYHILSEIVLENAQKLSKKRGGSKRRRSLAKSNRKVKDAWATDIQDHLQKLCGSDFRILHETHHALVVSKPSGMVCFHKRKTSSGKITASRLKKDLAGVDASLEDALLSQSIPLSTLNAEGRGLVHRIDRGTSGCIVLAKTDDMHARLLTEFFLRKVQKKYLAVVSTSTPLQQTGVLDIPVGGRPAQSTYKVTEQYSATASAIEIETKTGRKHQVRVHCTKGLEAPILLDPLYTVDESEEKGAIFSGLPESFEAIAEQSKFFLHASSLCIPSYEIDANAPLPEWWENAIMDLDKE